MALSRIYQGASTPAVIEGSLNVKQSLNLTGITGTTPPANATSNVVVPETLVTSTSKIFFTPKTFTTAGFPHVTAISPGVSFSFASIGGDTNTYDYLIIENA